MPELPPTRKIVVRVSVNGTEHEALVEPRRLLVDFLRDDLSLTGTHVGCEHGVCGACTVLLDGLTVRSCLLFAVQASGHRVMTIEGLAAADGTLHPIQAAFWTEHGLQCGFCTPGFLMTTYELLQANPAPTDDQIRAAISGNLCRCTGYQNIVRSVRTAADTMVAATAAPAVGGPA
ncbi:MAG TPA: (2Fe-2S)-binding protein [Chloroflexota bacterium]|jgi:carbon-monoxide dehydrogenase small subunit